MSLSNTAPTPGASLNGALDFEPVTPSRAAELLPSKGGGVPKYNAYRELARQIQPGQAFMSPHFFTASKMRSLKAGLEEVIEARRKEGTLDQEETVRVQHTTEGNGKDEFKVLIQIGPRIRRRPSMKS